MKTDWRFIIVLRDLKYLDISWKKNRIGAKEIWNSNKDSLEIEWVQRK